MVNNVNYISVGKTSANERQTYKVDQLLGLDYLNNILNIDDNHCVDCLNYVIKDGVLQKRDGFRDIHMRNVAGYEKCKLFNYKGTIYLFGYNTNGSFKIYELTINDNYVTSVEKTLTLLDGIVSATNCDDVSLVINKEKLLVFGLGKTYIINLETWNEEKPYTPLVFRGIQNDNNNNEVKAFEDFNLLSDLIRVSGKTHSNTVEYYAEHSETETNIRYSLPLPPITKYNGRIYKGIYEPFVDEDESGHGTFASSFNDTIPFQNMLKLKVNGKEYEYKIATERISLDGYTIVEGEGYFEIDVADGIYAYFESNTDDADKYLGEWLTFTKDIPNFLDGDNWELTYPYYVDGNKEKIYTTKIAKEYTGLGTSVLFVTDGSNVDYHSVNDDYTYFSDMNYASYGSDNNGIVGYETLNDGSLAVFKDDKEYEPSVYFRNAELVQAKDFSGMEVEGFRELEYPTKVGNSGETPLNKECIVRYNDKVFFLSKNGVQLLYVNSQSANTIKTSYCVSEYINRNLLKNINKETAKMFLLDEYLYVKSGNGEYYISPLILINQGKYEWFKVDVDIDNHFIGNSQELIYKNTYLKKKTDKKYDRPLLYPEMRFRLVSNGTYNDFNIYNIEMFMPRENASDTLFPLWYGLSNTDRQNKMSVIFSFRGEYLTCYNAITGETYNVYEIGCYPYETENRPNGYYFDVNTGQELFIKGYSFGQNIAYLEIYKRLPINSFYITKPYNFGTNDRAKHIYRYIIKRDTSRDYDLDIGVNIKNNYAYHLSSDANKTQQEWFSLFSFSTFALNDFENPYVATYKVHIKNINTLQFVFTSDNDKNSVITGFEVEYAYGFRNKGGW